MRMSMGATGIGQDNLLIYLMPGAGFEPAREHVPGDFTSKTVTEGRGPEILDRATALFNHVSLVLSVMRILWVLKASSGGGD